MKHHLMIAMILGGVALGAWLGVVPQPIQADSTAAVTPTICTLSGALIRRAGPAVGDLDHDGVHEIVVAGSDGMVYALNPDCSPVSGWPKQVNDYFVPPLVQAKSATQDIESTPVLADIDADGWLEVIVAVGFMPQDHTNGGLIVFEHNGVVKAGWPKISLDRHGAGDPPWNPDGFADGVFTTPAVGDVDGDGQPEIVYGGFDKCVYVWHGDGSPAAGWWDTVNNLPARCLDDTVWSSAALVDLDGDGIKDIVLGTDVHPQYVGGSVWALKGNNTILWIVYTTQTIQSSPAVGDINDDGYPEIVVGTGTTYPQGYMGYTDGYKVYAFDRFGNNLPGWPQVTNANMFASPALADLDGDGKLEILIGGGAEGDFATDRCLYVWRHTGQSFPGYPVTVKRAVLWSSGQVPAGLPYVPIVADYDSNGVLDVFIVSTGAWGVSAFPYNNPGALDPTKYLSNNQLFAPPLITNLYGDHRLHMIVGGATATGANGAVYIWKLSDASSGARPWPMARRDSNRTGAVPRPARLEISAQALYLLHQTGTTSPAHATLNISNGGDEAFSWSVTSKPAGVTVSPLSGTANQTVWISVTTTGKPNGANAIGNITISATSSGQVAMNSPRSVPVTLWIGEVKHIYLPLALK